MLKNYLLMMRDLIPYIKYNREYSKYDYFECEKLATIPDMHFPEIMNFNMSYGMYEAVCNLYGKRVNPLTNYIEHGLLFSETAALLEKLMNRYSIKRIFTYSEHRKQQLERILKNKLANVEIVPLGPFIKGASNFYSKEKLDAIKKRLGRTLLVFPMHSWPGVENDFCNDTFVQEIEKIRMDFDTVLVCMYYIDIKSGKHKAYEKMGYTIVSNGSRSDFSFLSRQKDLIELSDLTMSNGIGGHIGYSICLNKPHYYYQQNINFLIDEKAANTENPEMEYRRVIEKDFVSVFGNVQKDVSEMQKKFVQHYWGEWA